MRLRKLPPIISLLFCLLFFGCSPELDSDSYYKAANRERLGNAAHDLLSDDFFTSLKIEVAYVPGSEPSEQALEDIEEFLHRYIHKPEGISIVKTPIESPGKTSYSIDEIREIEDANRTIYNKGEELAVFVFFADGRSEAEDDKDMILGTAYRNTSIVIFENSLRELASFSVFTSKNEITEATLRHEFGHLFGLVDNGSADQSGHLDTENESHCNVSGCLMLASMEFGRGMLRQMKGSKTKMTFDEKCHQDLIANGGKR